MFQLRQIVTMNPGGFRGSGSQNGGTMLRVLGAAQKREVKATQNLSIIVLFFIICWMPLYTINCVKAFCPDCYIAASWTDFCIILSHLNSAVNPLLYAYHLKDFRAALKSLIYKMFGLKETNPINDTYYKPSIISQNHRRQSNMEKRPSILHGSQPKVYVDSPIWLRQKAAEMSNTPTCVPSISGAASPASVHSNVILTHTAMPNTPECNQNREIWMISEVPSMSDEREVSEECAEVLPQKRSLKPTLETLSDDYDDDDEVFLPSTNNAFAVIQYDFKNDDTYSTELPFREKRKSSNTFSDDSEGFSDIIVSSAKCNSESRNNHKNDVYEQDRYSLCSPIHKIFVVENDNTEMFRNSPNLSHVSNIAKENRLERKHSSSISSEYSCSPTKLSPLKIVGDFLFNQPSKKCPSQNRNSKTKRKAKYVLPKQSNAEVSQYLDLQKNGVIQNYRAVESTENR